MSLKIDRVELEIVIKNDESRKQLRIIEDQMKDVQIELSKAKKGTEAWIDASNRMKELKLAHDAIYEKIGLTNLSLKELNRRQKELSSILAQVPGDSPLYKKYNDQLNDVKGRIRELKGTAQETHFSLGKMADGFNRYFAMATAFAASLTGIAMGFKALKEERDKMEDSKANLKALTGLGQDDVDRLTEMAKKMSVNQLEGTGIRIRQSAQEIVDAYTKVGSQKPELLKDADALNEVTKQALILATASKMEVVPAAEGLTNMMNQYGVSASEAAHYMNVLAAGSQAGAKEVPYISEAMTKFGSVAKLANVPVEQAVALIETLGEKGHAAEISGTGLKTFFVKLMKGADETNPRVVGMTQALETLNTKFSGKGGFSKMAELFGIDNVVIAQTIIDQRKRFEELTTAVTGTAVGMEQAAINSTTPAAKMAQSVNQMKIAGIDLVNKLQPAMSMLTGWFSKTVQALPGLVDWFGKWGGVIVKTTIVLGAYVLATKLNVFWTAKFKDETILSAAAQWLEIQAKKVSTAATYLQAAAFAVLNGSTKLARLAMIDFFKTLGLNPFGAILMAVAALGVAVYTLATRTKELTEAQKAHATIQGKVDEGMAEHASKIDYLVAAIHNEKLALDRRRAAIEQLHKIIPGYNAVINEEGRIITENTGALKTYLTQLEREIRLTAAKEEYAELTKKQRLKEKEKAPLVEKLANSTNTHQRWVIQKDIDAINEEITALGEAKKTLADELGQIFIDPDTKSLSANLNAKGKKEWNRLIEEYKQRIVLIKKEHDESLAVFGLTAAQKFEIETNSNNRILAENAEYHKKQVDLSAKVDMNKPKPKDPSKSGETPEDKLAKLKAAQDKELQIDEDNYKKQQALLTTELYNNNKTEEQYQTENEVNELAYLEKKRTKLIKFGRETGDIDKQIADKKLEIQKKTIADLEKLFKDYEKKRKDETDLALKKSETAEQEEKNKLDRSKMTEQQYKDALLAIEVKYAKEREALAISPMDLVTQEQNKELALLNEKHKAGLISEKKYQEEVLRIKSEAFKQQLIHAGMTPEKAEELTKKTLALTGKEENKDDKTKERAAFTDKYGTEADKLIAWKKTEANILAEWRQKGIIDKDEEEAAKAQLDKEYNLKRIENYGKAAQEIGNIAGTLANAASGFQQVETQAVEMKYAKLIKAAGTNQKKVAKLEEQKEKELAEVRRKWADKQFILTAAQIVAQTAVAAITAYTSALAVPIIGPVLAPIAAAAAVAAGAAQLAVANQARDQAKSGLYSGGYSGDYVEGYTRRGNSRAEAGVIPIHSNEFVGNNDGVANPHVNQFYDIFNNAQKTGRIRMMNTTEILQNIRVRGMYDGGYSQTNRTTAQASGLVNGVPQSNNTMDTNRLTDVLTRLEAKMDKPMRGIVSIAGREGLKEQTALYDRMIAAKSR
ncbi:MAG: phage tail tape measure protein [Parachlamydiaceae bacterium]